MTHDGLDGIPNPLENIRERISETPREPDPLERKLLHDLLSNEDGQLGNGGIAVVFPGDVIEDENGIPQHVEEPRTIYPDSITVISTD